jgi:DNA mismatch repair protein MutS
LLDEIGRGTSTFDGLSLAWAVANWIATDIRALTLFATHYFELTTLPENLTQTRNVHLAAREFGEDIVFMYAVNDGPASQSYGLQVAKLAGVPQPVIHIAQEKLRQLEKSEDRMEVHPSQADLFVAKVAELDELRTRLRGLDVDSLSPRDALDLIYELHELSKN